jgi:iron complex outermembrane recepter protein
MMNRSKPLWSAVALALGGVSATGTAPAQEQGTDEQLETIVVTGSLLKRIDGEVALPVTTLKAEDLARAGATNALDALQLVGQNQSVTISNTSIGGGTGFASYASLRSLGSSRTLVLVDGKRVVNNPYQALGVDLNTIPMALVDRVEVLSDGASSTYGSDAIAGVVNFITRREVQGLSLSGTTSTPEAKGGGETYQASVGGGYGSLKEQGWNVYAGATWRRFDALANLDRDFAATTFRPERGFNRLNTTTFPANYTQSASGIAGANPSAPGCNPPTSLLPAANSRTCAYDFAPDIEAIPPYKQWSYVARGSYAFGTHVASLAYLRGESDLVSAISPPVLNGLTMTSVNPFYPGQGSTPGTAGLNPALPISVAWRMTTTGLSTSETETVTDRILAQLDGSVLGWDYQVSALTSEADVKLSFNDGYVNIQAVRNGLLGTGGAPFLNPFGDQSTQGRQYLLDSRLIGIAQRAKGDLDAYGAQASRALFNMPAGPLSLALAAEYKKEAAQFRNNFSLIRLGSGTGLENAQDTTGDRHASSLALETNVPLFEKFELGLSLRYDDYSDFGNTTNPKVSVRYQPVNALLLRGSYNTGFRAATLYDLYASPALLISRNRNNDPVLCPGGVANAAAGAVPTRDCNFQFNVQTAGNLNLDAEESDAFSIGFLLQPTSTLSFGADYWDYHVKQSIGALQDSAIFADLTKYGGFIVRCSQVPAVQRATITACTIPGGDPIAYVDTTTLNLGDTKTSGVDVTAQWSFDTGLGRFGFNYRGTYVTKYEFQREPGGAFFDRNGIYFDGNPIIRYMHYAFFNWDRGPWAARAANRHKSGYRDCNAQCNVGAGTSNPSAFFNDVGSYTLWDLSGTFTTQQNLAFTLGIQNVLDRDPPFTNKTSGLGSGWDERYVDPLGRTYSLLVSFQF